MTKTAKLVLMNKEKAFANLESLISDFEISNRDQVYIDDYKVLDYNSELSIESNNKQKSKNSSLTKLKVMIITIFVSSLTQSILYVFILPNRFSWPDKVVPFLLIFFWVLLFNSAFFIPGAIKIIANYLNEAFADYECLSVY
jgi:hypothetical protein